MTTTERIINFDNAATSFPKPRQVRAAVTSALERFGGNPSRGGHRLALAASSAVYEARCTAADFFDASPENTVFTLNCTHALNFAIKGIMRPGEHLVISSLEHNSVSRPAVALKKSGCDFSVFKVYPDSRDTLRSLREAMTPQTKAVACTLASNVTGQLLPFREIGEICRRSGVCFIADGAQACGVIPVSLENDNINILCTAGHKALYGLTGTGLLLSDGSFTVQPIIEGGTGSDSENPAQPLFLPDSLEAGTLNTIGAISVNTGIKFISAYRLDRIRAHEEKLCAVLINGLERMGAEIYRFAGAEYVPIVSFNIPGKSPEQLAAYLNERGICMRAGLHCAGLAHKSGGTPDGTIRFAPSIFNSENEVLYLLSEINKFL